MKIYQPKGAAREYSPFALNIFSGCPNGCKYCYVPRIFARNTSYKHDDVFLKKDITTKDIWKEVESFARSANREEQILLSFTGDIFCGLEKEKVAEVLQALNHYELNYSVLTKRAQNAVEFVSYFQHNEKAKFGVSLTFHDEQKSREWEPFADTPEERLQALSYFKQSGVTTWASFEPVIETAESFEMLQEVIRFSLCDFVKIGAISGRADILKANNWLEFVTACAELCRGAKLPVYFKNDLAKQVPHFYFIACERYADYFTRNENFI